MCIVCGKESPKSRVRVSTEWIEGWKSVSNRRLGIGKPTDRAFTADATACGLCRWRFQFMVYGGFVLACAILIPIYVYYHDVILEHLSKRTVIFLSGLAMLPLVLGWMMIFRPPLEMKAVGDEILFSFTNEAFKNEFESLNPRSESPIDAITRNLEENPFS